MKKALAISLALNVALAAGLLWKDLVVPVEAGAREGRGAEEGEYFACADSNGDGLLNIADPVHTLRYLFSEAPEPRCEAVPAGGLPATGETKCYDSAGGEIDCASADFPGQDGFHQAGCPMEGRYVDNGDGTVTDTCTGRMWQKDTADVSGNGSIGDEDILNWQGALKYCYGLDFAGHSDWRLPNVREIQSIVDYGRRVPAIDPVFGAGSYWYWSSSSFVFYPGYAWGVNFDVGLVGSLDDEGYQIFVRAVRSGP